MLRLAGDQVESLLDELLPAEVRELPAELAALDRLLADPRLLAPIQRAWEQTARDHGRPTIPMGGFVRLMVIKQRTGWGTRRWSGRCRTRCTCAGSACCR
jgi:transposase, IS5 family